MNIFLDPFRWQRSLFVLAMLFVFLAPGDIWALDANRTLSQYVHNSWGSDGSFAGGIVFAIAQSKDGYIWLGTEHGLVRFDGISFTQIENPVPQRPPIGAVRGLIEDARGNLWVRLNGPRLLKYRDGVFQEAQPRSNNAEAVFTAMSLNSQGDLLLWGPKHRSIQFHENQFRPLPRDDIKGIVISSLQTGSGTLWLGTRDVGLYQVQNGHATKVLDLTGVQSVNALAPSVNEGVWIGSEAGLRLWEHGSLVPLNLPPQLRTAQILALVLDRNQNLWVGTESGLYRVDSKLRVVTGFLRSTARTEIRSIFEDSDGDIWFAGAHGIERLRDGMFTTVSLPESAQKANGGPIFTDDSGRVWFAPASGGLSYFDNGTIKPFAVPGLRNDVIYSIAGGKGELWLGRQQGGLTEITHDESGWHFHTFTAQDGLAQNSVYTVTRAYDGTVWAGTVSGGISMLRHGHFTNYTVNNGLQSNAAFSSMESADHRMWFASPSGLTVFDGTQWTTFGAVESEPSANVRTVFEDSGKTLWIGTSHGIARLIGGHIQMLPSLPQMLTEEILSIGQDRDGFLWVVTAQHVLQVNRDELLAGQLNERDIVSYGADDGLVETEGVRRDRSLIPDYSGRIWLSLPHSLAVADMNAAGGYRLPARVRIDAVLAGDVLSNHHETLELPSQTQNITFRYSGTNMSMSQRTQFRYRLENSDQAWSSDATLRQVVYTHLSPGTYTFRIKASNGLGIWNGPESYISFHIQPAWWQTWYFRVLCALACAFAIFLIYRIRMMRLTEQLNRRFRDRLAERTRIAQDLHDTLLQGVISASMQLDVAEGRVPEESPARPLLRRVLHLMRQVTEEGRAALKGLRRIEGVISPEEAFAPLAKEPIRSSTTEFRLSSEGVPQALQGFVLDEVYRIGREACINAFSHASASHVEIIIEYGRRNFRLLIRDDGQGIDGQILKNGRDGHWGLAGMRERAHAIQSNLKIRSRYLSGTEVELIVPAAVAYCHKRTPKHWPARLWRHYFQPGRKLQPPL